MQVAGADAGGEEARGLGGGWLERRLTLSAGLDKDRANAPAPSVCE